MKERFEKFFSKGKFLDPADDSCWEWCGGKCKGGYGNFWLNGKMENAHRVSYEIYNGPIPENTIVRHRCDNPGCVNPGHLELGTHRDNAQDAKQRGRNNFGERNGSAKLTDDQIRDIIKDESPTSQIAAKYGVNRRIIRRIKRRELWQHVEID